MKDLNKLLIAVSAIILLLASMYVVEARIGLGAGEDALTTGPGTGTTTNTTAPEPERFEDTGTLRFGIAGFGSSASFNFEVREGATEVHVICDGSNGTLRGDIDMEVYGAKNNGKHKSSASAGSYEEVIIDETDIRKRFGYGQYEVQLICYSGVNLDYTIYCTVSYGNTTDAEDTGEVIGR